jgi:hypothetical protein
MNINQLKSLKWVLFFAVPFTMACNNFIESNKSAKLRKMGHNEIVRKVSHNETLLPEEQVIYQAVYKEELFDWFNSRATFYEDHQHVVNNRFLMMSHMSDLEGSQLSLSVNELTRTEPYLFKYIVQSAVAGFDKIYINGIELSENTRLLLSLRKGKLLSRSFLDVKTYLKSYLPKSEVGLILRENIGTLLEEQTVEASALLGVANEMKDGENIMVYFHRLNKGAAKYPQTPVKYPVILHYNQGSFYVISSVGYGDVNLSSFTRTALEPLNPIMGKEFLVKKLTNTYVDLVESYQGKLKKYTEELETLMVGSLAYQEVEYRIQSLNSSLQEYAIADTEAAFKMICVFHMSLEQKQIK